MLESHNPAQPRRATRLLQESARADLQTANEAAERRGNKTRHAVRAKLAIEIPGHLARTSMLETLVTSEMNATILTASISGMCATKIGQSMCDDATARRATIVSVRRARASTSRARRQ